MESGLSDTFGIPVGRKIRSRHSNHVQPGEGEWLVLRDLEAFTPDLLVTEKAAVHQTVRLPLERSPWKMFQFSL